MLAGCQEPVTTIAYTQVGACDAGAHKAHVFFQLGQIDNSNSDRDFTFLPIRLRLDADMIEAAPWPHYERLTTEMLVGEAKSPARKTAVAKGTKAFLGSFVVFRRETIDPDGSRQANNSAYFLSYDRDTQADPSVLAVKSNPTQTEWRDTSSCADIVAPRQSCSGCHSNDPVKLRKESQIGIFDRDGTAQ